MKKDIIIVILLAVCVVSLILTNFGNTQSKIYDCTISEISPDFPIEVREECRKLRYEQWKKEQEEIRQSRLVNT